MLMKFFEVLIIVILMSVPFFLFKNEDFTTFIYWTVVTTGYLLYIVFSSKRWINE